MKLFRTAIISAVFVAVGALSRADPVPTVHYAPAENLKHIDVDLIDSAKHEIDFVAYVLTDWPVMKALTRAAERGAKVRIYLDGSQLAEREPTKVFQDLAHMRLTAICSAPAPPISQRQGSSGKTTILL